MANTNKVETKEKKTELGKMKMFELDNDSFA